MDNQTALHVHLQDGFESERVVVTVNKTIVFDDPIVRTKPQIGLAGMVDVNASATDVPVRIDLMGRGRTGTIQINVKQTPYVGVSVANDGSVTFKTQSEPFGYL